MDEEIERRLRDAIPSVLERVLVLEAALFALCETLNRHGLIDRDFAEQFRDLVDGQFDGIDTSKGVEALIDRFTTALRTPSAHPPDE